MRYVILLFIGSVVFSCNNATDKEIVTELFYFPEQHTGVTDQLYRKWTIILTNIYEKIEVNDGSISHVDHINIANALIKLKGSKQKVLDQLHMAQQKDLKSVAYLFPMIYKSSEQLTGYLTPHQYDSMLVIFESVIANDVENKIHPELYAKEGGYDIELVKLMAELLDKDQEFRISDMERQQLIDLKNIKTIDSLYHVYETYIGESLVGEKYKLTMQIIIQHADLEHQEKYLPILHQAVKNNEVPKSVLKLLIDRIHNKKHGNQIFGTQSGVDLADDQTLREVKLKFEL